MIRRFVAILLLAGACLGQTPGTKEIKVAPEVLSRYVGIYAMSPTVNMTITLVDGQLVSQMTGQGKVGLSPQSDTTFTPQGINAEINFPKDEKGPASQLILHQNSYVAFGHGGAVAGYTSSLMMNRLKGIGVIVFSNGAANPDGIANQALDILSK